MVKCARVIVLLVLVSGSLALCAVPEGSAEEGPDPKRHAAALKLIERHLAAVGGEESLRAIRSLDITGGGGYPGYPPSETATIYVKAPDLYKQIGSTSVVLSAGDRQVMDTGNGEEPLPEDLEARLRFLVPFTLDAFSLLRWESHFGRAEYLGKKTYGEEFFYVLRIPEAQEGQDVTVYLRSDDYTIDRVVFQIPDPKGEPLQQVSRLREYATFDGVRFPTTVLLEYVGWRERDRQYTIESVKVNPDLNAKVFQEAMLDWGTLEIGEDSLTGEVRSSQYGVIFSNVSEEHLGRIGVKDGDWVLVTLGERSLKARFIDEYEPPEESGPVPTYARFVVHPRASYARLLLLPVPGDNLAEVLPFEVGDTFVVEKTEPDEAEPSEDENQIDPGEDHEEE